MKKWILSSFMLLLVLQNQLVMAAPKADLWSKWLAHNEKNIQAIDHSAWSQFLTSHLKDTGGGINLVGYQNVGDQGKKLLDKYLSALQAVKISDYSRPEQFAYWVNLYNAKTVDLILDHYPVDSIRDISFGWFSFGPWDEKLLKVEGEPVSLNDIEHRILRPIWKDNRIHYAVNCASIGCPNLASTAYTSSNYESLLDKGASEYINHPRGAEVKNNTLILSEIYNWYAVDFGDSESGLIEHLKQYATDDLKAKLSTKLDVEYRYDWRLNQSR